MPLPSSTARFPAPGRGCVTCSGAATSSGRLSDASSASMHSKICCPLRYSPWTAAVPLHLFPCARSSLIMMSVALAGASVAFVPPATMQPLTRTTAVADVTMMARNPPRASPTKPVVDNKAKPLSPGSNCAHTLPRSERSALPFSAPHHLVAADSACGGCLRPYGALAAARV